MLMSVYERVREIGTMAAMGTAPSRILSMFVLEGLTLGVAGAAVGSVLSAVAILVLRASHVTFDFGRQTGLVLEPTLSPVEMIAVSGVVVAVAIAASVQPALKAARMQPVVALKHG
jgi:putative ABC transport system permease protein